MYVSLTVMPVSDSVRPFTTHTSSIGKAFETKFWPSFTMTYQPAHVSNLSVAGTVEENNSKRIENVFKDAKMTVNDLLAMLVICALLFWNYAIYNF